MGEAYGYVLLAVFAVVVIAITTIIFLRRNHPIIKSRDPLLLVVQNLGSLLVAALVSIYIALRPQYPCCAYYTGLYGLFAFFIFPLAIRCWAYAINFYLSKVRSKFRANVLLPDWGGTSWFVRNRWIGSVKFLRKVLFGGFWIFLIPIIPYCADDERWDYDSDLKCPTGTNGMIATIVFMVFFVVVAIFVSILTWNMHDAYMIKFEIKLLPVIWVLETIAFFIYSRAPGNVQSVVPPTIWNLIGLYASFLLCNLYPLYLDKKEQRVIPVGEAAQGFEEFVNQLEFLPFRNAFRDFLALQFCQENILFYENVCDWKRMSGSDNERIAIAKAIRDNYILESGVCQINISGPTRERVVTAVARDAIPNDVFDEALNAVLSNMHVNSYYQFKSHALYNSAKA